MRYAARINGLTEFVLTKLDVLSGLERVKVAVAYERDGQRIENFPAEFGLDVLAECKPIYEDLPGWSEDITGARTREDLPDAARAYVEFIEAQAGVPISTISVGPEREQVIW
jgi:adenylosuccinate synthase